MSGPAGSASRRGAGGPTSTLPPAGSGGPGDGEIRRRAAVRDAVVLVREKLTRHPDYLDEDELRTRTIVVDEILGALGWDVRDPAQVSLEHRDRRTRIDYVLLAGSGRALAVIEAKRSGLALTDRIRSQTTGCAAHLRVPVAIVTNGRRWEARELRRDESPWDAFLARVNLGAADVDGVVEALLPLQPERLGR